MSAVLMILVLVLLIAVRVPVGVALMVPSLLYLMFDSTAQLDIAAQQLVGGADNFALLAVPMFILLGNLANASGVTDRIFDFATGLLGRTKGGLGYVNVVTSFGFSWVSGAAISDAATMGKIQVPQMVKRGYSPDFTLGLTGASSLIAPMIPPSIPAVIYSVTAGVSVTALFFAGIIPAVLFAVLLLIYVFFAARRSAGACGQTDEGPEASLWKLSLNVLPVLGAPVVVLGGILGGIFTPTEASAAGVFYILIIGLLFRSFTLVKLRDALVSTTSTAASIMFIVVGAALFGWVLAREQVPQNLADAVLSLTENPYVFMALLVVILLAVGAVLEPTAAILIMVPVLSPMAPAFGIEPVHMGVVVVLTLMIGLVTPPVGLVLFVLSSVTGYGVGQVMRGVAPFYTIMLVVLCATAFLPLLVYGVGN